MRLAEIRESVDPHMPGSSCDFQFGDCGIEVLRVVNRALASGFNRFTVVEGMVYLNGTEDATPHTWIEMGGEVRDPTVTQFEQSQIVYSPPGEYREEYTPQRYVSNFQFQYGIDPSEVT